MSEEKKEYPRPSLTADIVVLALDAEGALRVLVIRRGGAPYQGCWALPGGFCEPGETVMQAAARELTEETELRDVRMEELRSFTTPGRDPRGWVVSVAHLALLPSARQREARAGDDASETAWLRLRIGKTGDFQLEHEGAPVALSTLAFDHREVLAVAVEHLRERVDTLAFALLVSPFTLNEARLSFEAILGARLDADAFPRLLLEQGWVREVARIEGAGASAARYQMEPHTRRWPWAPQGKG